MLKLRSTTTMLLAAAFLVGCDDDDPVLPDPSLTLTVNPATLSVQQGATGTVAITVVREDTDDPVSVTVTGGGTGVTGAISGVTHTGDQTTATLTVTVTQAAAAGPYTLTVLGANGDADDVTKTVTVTVTEASGGGA
jgi:hypothetical protein